MDIESAQKTGAMMLFGEKYGDEGARAHHRLVQGTVRRHPRGPHRRHRPVQDHPSKAAAAGVRRIEAVCGDVAVALVQDQQKLLDGVTGALKAQPQEVLTRVGQVIDTIKSQEKSSPASKSKLAASQGDDLAARPPTSPAPRCWPRRWRAPTWPPCARPSTS